MKPPLCLECGKPARLTNGKEIYPHRADLADLHFWKCECGAYCGCHKMGTGMTPLGHPCNAETRAARSAAHAAFDPLWQRKMRQEGMTKSRARARGYKWLAEQLSIDPKDCHIGMMKADMARRVVEVCQRGRVSK